MLYWNLSLWRGPSCASFVFPTISKAFSMVVPISKACFISPGAPNSGALTLPSMSPFLPPWLPSRDVAVVSATNWWPRLRFSRLPITNPRAVAIFLCKRFSKLVTNWEHGHTTTKTRKTKTRLPKHEETLKPLARKSRELYVSFKQQQCVKGEERSGDVRVWCRWMILALSYSMKYSPSEDRIRRVHNCQIPIRFLWRASMCMSQGSGNSG